MDLTDQQWALLQPLVDPASNLSSSPESNARPLSIRSLGRPLLDERAVLNGILWKIRTRSPWYDMPSCYPSHQTCYRRYRQWKRTGILLQIFQALYRDLRDRGGLDFKTVFQDGAFRFEFKNKHWEFISDPRLQGTWQLSTLMLFTSMMVQYLKSPSPTSHPFRGSQPPPSF